MASYVEGGLSGAGTGAATGAAIGSIVPGVGTGIGAAVGGGLGLIGGLWSTKKKKEAEEKAAKEAAALRAQGMQMFDTVKGQVDEDRARALQFANNAGSWAPSTVIGGPQTVIPGSMGERQVMAPTMGREHSAGRTEQVGVRWMPDVKGFEAATIGGGQDVGTAPVSKATINPAAMGMIEEMARGEGPSKAEHLMRSGLDKVAQQQLGVAAGARGAERAGARREAMLAIGQQGADATEKAAGIKAEEQIAARGQMAQMATQAAALEQQANSLTAQIRSAEATGNAERAQQLRAQQAQLIQQAREFKASADNQRATTEGQMKLQADTRNAEAAERRGDLEADRRTKVEDQWLGRGLEASTTNATLGQQRDIESSRQWLDAGKFNADNKLATDKARADQEIQGRQVAQSGQYQGLGLANDGTGHLTQIGGTILGEGRAAKADATAAADRAARDSAAAVQGVVTGAQQLAGSWADYKKKQQPTTGSSGRTA